MQSSDDLTQRQREPDGAATDQLEHADGALAETPASSDAVGGAQPQAPGQAQGPAQPPGHGDPHAAAAEARPPARSTWILIVCCVAQFMVILDLSIVNVALPSIQSSLGFSSADLQWVVNAYAITFAGFLMLGGRAADHFGQRRTFTLALLLFALVSLAGGLAPDRW